MGENTMIVFKRPDNSIGETGQAHWYENEDLYQEKGYQKIDAYNSALNQHRNYVKKKYNL